MHVLHVLSPSSNAVRHPISGTLDDVPVPVKINSSASSGISASEDLIVDGCMGGVHED